MLRRTEPRAVTVWLALKEARTVTLRIYAKNAEGKLVQQLEGTRHTVRLGDHLHIVAVTARATNSIEHLAWGGFYYYDLFFQPGQRAEGSVPETAAHLDTPGILTPDPSPPQGAVNRAPTPHLSPPEEAINRAPLSVVYPGHPLPG